MFVGGAHSDKGRKSENQDALFLSSCNASGFNDNEHHINNKLMALLADGVSSCKKPKQASTLAIQVFWEKLLECYKKSNHSEGMEAQCNMETSIASALSDANDALYFTDHYERQPALLYTLTGVIF